MLWHLQVQWWSSLGVVYTQTAEKPQQIWPIVSFERILSLFSKESWNNMHLQPQSTVMFYFMFALWQHSKKALKQRLCQHPFKNNALFISDTFISICWYRLNGLIKCYPKGVDKDNNSEHNHGSKQCFGPNRRQAILLPVGLPPQRVTNAEIDSTPWRRHENASKHNYLWTWLRPQVRHASHQ